MKRTRKKNEQKRHYSRSTCHQNDLLSAIHDRCQCIPKLTTIYHHRAKGAEHFNEQTISFFRRALQHCNVDPISYYNLIANGHVCYSQQFLAEMVKHAVNNDNHILFKTMIISGLKIPRDYRINDCIHECRQKKSSRVMNEMININNVSQYGQDYIPLLVKMMDKETLRSLMLDRRKYNPTAVRRSLLKDMKNMELLHEVVTESIFVQLFMHIHFTPIQLFKPYLAYIFHLYVGDKLIPDLEHLIFEYL